MSGEAMTKPTNKERVLKRWPDAVCKRSALLDGYSVYQRVHPQMLRELATGPTPAAAWRDAAERMK